MTHRCVWTALLALACAPRPAAQSPSSAKGPEGATSSAPKPPPSPARESSEGTEQHAESSHHRASPAPEACGPFSCFRFADASKALLHVVRVDEPRVLGIGESHARADTAHVASAASRFKRELLPALAHQTSDLVVELLAPPGDCAPETTERVEQEERQITAGQSADNQHQFVALGHKARDVGVTPYILRASCDDLSAIAQAGDDGVLVLMETIARLTAEQVGRLLARQADADRLVMAYGGALHNDLAPRPGRETWSYGPALQELTNGKYTEVDLIVPEHIRDSDAWRAFPWYAHLPPLAPDSAVILELAPRSWVLFFPTGVAEASRATPPPPANANGAPPTDPPGRP